MSSGPPLKGPYDPDRIRERVENAARLSHERGADAEWDALRDEFAKDDRWTNASVFIERHRPLIEAASRGDGFRATLTDDEWADVVDVYGSFGSRLVADRIERALSVPAPTLPALDLRTLQVAAQRAILAIEEEYPNGYSMTGDLMPRIAREYEALRDAV